MLWKHLKRGQVWSHFELSKDKPFKLTGEPSYGGTGKLSLLTSSHCDSDLRDSCEHARYNLNLNWWAVHQVQWGIHLQVFSNLACWQWLVYGLERAKRLSNKRKQNSTPWAASITTSNHLPMDTVSGTCQNYLSNRSLSLSPSSQCNAQLDVPYNIWWPMCSKNG